MNPSQSAHGGLRGAPPAPPRRWQSRRCTLGMLCFLLSTSVALSCQRKKSPPAGQQEQSYDLDIPSVDPQGPYFHHPDFDLKIGQPEPCPSDGVLAPPDGFERWSYPVEIVSKTSKDVPVAPMLFSIPTEETPLFPTLASCRPNFWVTQLSKGKMARAYVTFDIPRGGEVKELRFEPFIIGRRKIVARALLPRRDIP